MTDLSRHGLEQVYCLCDVFSEYAFYRADQVAEVVERLQKQINELAVAKQRLERACIKAAAPEFMTQAEREALDEFVQALRSTKVA